MSGLSAVVIAEMMFVLRRNLLASRFLQPMPKAIGLAALVMGG